MAVPGHPHPTDKKSTRKRAEDSKRNQEWSQGWTGGLPCTGRLITGEEAPFFT